MTDIEGRRADASGTTDEVLDERTVPEAVLAEVHDLRAELDQLRTEVARLDADLGESRKLNLRAAELLDLVYERLGERLGGAPTGLEG
jgi:hypothetical protein